jgi:hypothetical protein
MSDKKCTSSSSASHGEEILLCDNGGVWIGMSDLWVTGLIAKDRLGYWMPFFLCVLPRYFTHTRIAIDVMILWLRPNRWYIKRYRWTDFFVPLSYIFRTSFTHNLCVAPFVLISKSYFKIRKIQILNKGGNNCFSFVYHRTTRVTRKEAMYV